MIFGDPFYWFLSVLVWLTDHPSAVVLAIILILAVVFRKRSF